MVIVSARMPVEAIQPEYKLSLEIMVVTFGLNISNSANLRLFEIFHVERLIRQNPRGYADGYAMKVDASKCMVSFFSLFYKTLLQVRKSKVVYYH